MAATQGNRTRKENFSYLATLELKLFGNIFCCTTQENRLLVIWQYLSLNYTRKYLLSYWVTLIIDLFNNTRK
jgi:hypothetical protein